MADDSEDEWRFSIDEVGPDDEEEDANDEYSVQVIGEDDDGPTVGVATADGEVVEDDDGGNIAGSIAPDMSVEPGTPDLEGAVFATAGAVLTALVFAAIVVPLDATTIAGIAGSIVAVAAVLYVIFLRF